MKIFFFNFCFLIFPYFFLLPVKIIYGKFENHFGEQPLKFYLFLQIVYLGFGKKNADFVKRVGNSIKNKLKILIFFLSNII